MKKIMAAMAFTLVALFSAPVVYAAECKSISKVEANEALEGTTKLVFSGRQAGDFIRSLAEAAVEAGKAPSSDVDSNLAKLPPFASVTVYVKAGVGPTIFIILFDADDCAVSAGEFQTEIVAKALEKITA